MELIATYVFFDTEATGLPKFEENQTKITELSLVAVKRRHLEGTRKGQAPRVQNKLTICLNPLRKLQQRAAHLTKLNNKLLENEPPFGNGVSELICAFFSLLEKPVCLVAYNGNRFDYPILKKHLDDINVSLPGHLLCADAYEAFYEIIEKKPRPKPDLSQKNIKEVNSQVKDLNLQKGTDLKTVPAKNQEPTATVSKEDKSDVDNEKPTVSYKLAEVYKRLLKRSPKNAHTAETDCMMMMECAVMLAEHFGTWVDKNNVLFSEVEPMQDGVFL